jgi:CpXC protein
MPISFQEHAELTCPDCGADFTADVWLVLDAGEQPDEVAALRSAQLNIVACPSCGNSGPAGAPLLYHDGAARKVIFAPAPGSEEHEWREQARDLHALLVGSIAEDQRRPYLADVDIVQDLAGVGRLLERMARRRGAGQGDKGARGQGDRATPPTTVAAPAKPTTHHPPPTTQPPLLAAVEALLAADTAEELRAVLAGHPVLLDPSTDAALAELADVAVAQREPEIAESLGQARKLLARAARGGGLEQAIDDLSEPSIASDPEPGPMAERLEPALQALLLAGSAAELAQALERFPLLALPEIDGLLSERVELALDAGDERHAADLEDRREVLAQLRGARAAQPAEAAPAADAPTIDEAIEALLLADGEEAMAVVIDAYPVLLEDVAAQALWQFAAEARASGDEDLAIFAIECREMLRRVREGLGN